MMSSKMYKIFFAIIFVGISAPVDTKPGLLRYRSESNLSALDKESKHVPYIAGKVEQPEEKQEDTISDENDSFESKRSEAIREKEVALAFSVTSDKEDTQQANMIPVRTNAQTIEDILRKQSEKQRQAYDQYCLLRDRTVTLDREIERNRRGSSKEQGVTKDTRKSNIDQRLDAKYKKGQYEMPTAEVLLSASEGSKVKNKKGQYEMPTAEVLSNSEQEQDVASEGRVCSSEVRTYDTEKTRSTNSESMPIKYMSNFRKLHRRFNAKHTLLVMDQNLSFANSYIKAHASEDEYIKLVQPVYQLYPEMLEKHHVRSLFPECSDEQFKYMQFFLYDRPHDMSDMKRHCKQFFQSISDVYWIYPDDYKNLYQTQIREILRLFFAKMRDLQAIGGKVHLILPYLKPRSMSDTVSEAGKERFPGEQDYIFGGYYDLFNISSDFHYKIVSVQKFKEKDWVKYSGYVHKKHPKSQFKLDTTHLREYIFEKGTFFKPVEGRDFRTKKTVRSSIYSVSEKEEHDPHYMRVLIAPDVDSTDSETEYDYHSCVSGAASESIED